MTHHAKAPSAGSTQATGSSRGLFRRALVTRGALGRSKGSGAPSSRRARATLAVLALAIAAFALTAAPALAAPISAKVTAVSGVSYDRADATGKVTSSGGIASFTVYKFEYCSAECSEAAATWTPDPAFRSFGGAATDKVVDGEFTGLKSNTKYSVRLSATNFSESTISPAPYTEFTTLTADPTSVVSIENASDVAYTTATAKGVIDRPVKSNNVACHFEYITDQQFNENLGNTAPGFQGATPLPCEPEPRRNAGFRRSHRPRPGRSQTRRPRQRHRLPPAPRRLQRRQRRRQRSPLDLQNPQSRPPER